MSGGFLGSSLKAGRLRTVNACIRRSKCGWSNTRQNYPRSKLSRRIAFFLHFFRKLMTRIFCIIKYPLRISPILRREENPLRLVTIVRFELVANRRWLPSSATSGGIGSSVGEAFPPMRCGSRNGGLFTKNAVSLWLLSSWTLHRTRLAANRSYASQLIPWDMTIGEPSSMAPAALISTGTMESLPSQILTSDGRDVRSTSCS